ncbi:hypothetical protein [Parasedimentitalea maritima]|uniref:hypothetical protein n=1 Tax=Parasedimentitalea maritima TaxID=2578117 RepID=UPI001484F9ED|nr:hypothetical protein [Zongyanglinia marina]
MFMEYVYAALALLLGCAVVAAILYGMFSKPTPHKKLRSRSTFTHGIDDVSVPGDGTND